MREKITYIAADDTEFDDVKECEEYENQLIFNKTTIKLWDKEGNPITEFSSNTVGNVCFIRVTNEDDREFLRYNFPCSIEWDDSNFYFMSELESTFISPTYYKNKHLEKNYLTALEIEERK